MKIYSLAIFIFLCVCFSANAQESSIIVLSVSGHIEFMEDQSGLKERLLPGMKISTSGAVHLKRDSKVNLLHNGKRIQIEEEGVYELKTLTEKNDKAQSMGFAGRFWNFVSDGLSQSDDKNALNDYNERLLAVTGGVKGYALDESAFQTIMPTDGNIGVNIVTFNWHRLKNKDAHYHFKIFHTDHEKLVFKAVTRDTSITLDFSQLVFHPEESYEWIVEMEEGSEMVKSDLKTFKYYSNADEIIKQKAATINDYKKAGDFEKKWMEAIVMEQENFIFDAFVRYSDMRSQNPDNLLIKKLFASFLVRQGLTQKAIEQINE